MPWWAMDYSASPRQLAGRYEVRQVLGQGGMGLVYRAYDTVVRREVGRQAKRSWHPLDKTEDRKAACRSAPALPTLRLGSDMDHSFICSSVLPPEFGS